MCERINCGYFWKEDGEDFPCCHYDSPYPAPCECDDYDTPDYDDEEF